MAAKISHIGEFHDDVVYSHKRVATILGRQERWVIERMFEPQEDRDPIRHARLGTLYMTTGEAIRLWLENQIDLPHTPGDLT